MTSNEEIATIIGRYINSNKYHLTDNIKFYGCDIESDFAIAKHVHENKDKMHHYLD